jgi:hypothetical protein
MPNIREYSIEKYGAVEQPDGSWLHTGTISWFNEYGDYHNVTGPACIESNGDTYWRIHGKTLSFDEWLKLSTKSDEDKMLLRLQYG